MIYYNYYKTHNKWNSMDLNVKALGFRLLRQHGYQVPQGKFNKWSIFVENWMIHIRRDLKDFICDPDACGLVYIKTNIKSFFFLDFAFIFRDISQL